MVADRERGIDETNQPTAQPGDQAILPIRDGWSGGRQLDLPRAP